MLRPLASGVIATMVPNARVFVPGHLASAGPLIEPLHLWRSGCATAARARLAAQKQVPPTKR